MSGTPAADDAPLPDDGGYPGEAPRWRVVGAEAVHTQADAGDLPPLQRFGVVWKWWAIALGAVVDIAVEVLLQMFGVQPLDTADLAVGILRGSIIGFLAPNVGAAIGTVLANREIRALRAEAGA